MASGKSDYAENKVLDALLGGAALGAPASGANWHIALFTAAPSDTGGGTEATGGGYARLAVVNNLTNFPAAAGGAKSNAFDLVWAVSTGAWSSSAPIVAAALFDASTGGNMWYWGDILLASQQAITAVNQQFVLRAGDLDITED